jgi:two-component sensor histidine kinase
MADVAPSTPHDQLLLRELIHRVNNEFSSIINGISLAAARSSHREVRAALSVALEMLHSYADVHRALKMPTVDTQVNAASYLCELCQALRRAKLERMGIDLSLECAPLTLAPERAWRLGLIVYELVTNATRHAFKGHAGAISIKLELVGAFVHCKVTDDGSASTNNRAGQGLTIIRQLAGELGGTAQHQFGSNGSTSILAFPFREKAIRIATAAARRTERKFPVTPIASARRPRCRLQQLSAELAPP